MSANEPNESGNIHHSLTTKYQCLNYVLTWNNYPDSVFELLRHVFDSTGLDIAKDGKWVFGKEVGASGTPHIQGAFCLRRKRRAVELQNLFLPDGTKEEKNKIILTKMNGRWNDQIYCCKDGDYITGNKPGGLLKWRQELPNKYQWQEEITALLLNAPDERTIYWYFEPTGCTGKTTFGKWMCTHPEEVGGNLMILSGKSADMKNGIIERLKRAKGLPRTIILNVPRTNLEFLSYTGIEEVKDMFFYSGKYEGGEVCGPCPHLVVFANEPPKLHKVSEDRWVIKLIKDNTAVPWEPPPESVDDLCLNYLEMKDRRDDVY